MNCPRIYIKINKSANVIIPVSGINNKLDNAFRKPEVLNYNRDHYGPYTLEIIKSCDASDIYWSEKYNYNPKEFAFDFFEINVCTNDDYIAMSTLESEFNPKTAYNVEKVTSENNNGPFSVMDTIKNNYPCPDISTGFYIEEKRWNILVRNILKHKNTMLVGPTGTGKTDVIIRICKALGIPCRIYDMGAMMDPLTDLLGSHRLENGSSKFDYAKFVQDIQEPGVILLDELSRAPLMTNNILFPCLDDRRMLPVEIADSNNKRSVPVHPECTFIATANIGSEYSGTNDIDAALENRFMTIQVDYLPKTIESEIVNIRTGCNPKAAEKVVSVANVIRERYLDGTLSKTISTRETLMCGELIQDGFHLLDAISFVFCEKFQKYGENSEYDTVKKIIIGL